MWQRVYRPQTLYHTKLPDQEGPLLHLFKGWESTKPVWLSKCHFPKGVCFMRQPCDWLILKSTSCHFLIHTIELWFLITPEGCSLVIYIDGGGTVCIKAMERRGVQTLRQDILRDVYLSTRPFRAQPLITPSSGLQEDARLRRGCLHSMEFWYST